METYPTNINDSIIESLSKGVLNLGNECRALAEENKRLKEENERYRLASLRVDVGELHAQFNRALFDETVAENARLKSEVEELQRLLTAATFYKKGKQ